ncbi:transposable element Tcb1 transposase [Trichonephila clavipes]|nr:transposable element Tcb1 transposase [Trichonephila clavipes]
MALADHSVTSRIIAQHIESVTHHSVSVRTIRRRLQQSGLFARRSLLGLPLTQKYKHLHRQWCDERRMRAAEWNEVIFTEISFFKISNSVFFLGFFKKRSVMSRRKQRSAYDQVSNSTQEG